MRQDCCHLSTLKQEVLRLKSVGAYWLSCRNRVLGQFVVWNDNSLIGDFGKETE